MRNVAIGSYSKNKGFQGAKSKFKLRSSKTEDEKKSKEVEPANGKIEKKEDKVKVKKTKPTRSIVAESKKIKADPPKKKRKRRKLSRFGKFFVFFVLAFICVSVLVVLHIFKVPVAQNIASVVSNNPECKDILSPKCWTDVFHPELLQTDGFTNTLIVGLDTRDSGSGIGLQNTDSILVLSYNHKTNETILISIPRDFYVAAYAARVNAIYAFTQQKNPDDPFFYLKDEVSKIIGQDIHYFATVKFEGVIGAIDAIGGVEVCPASAFTAMYPNDDATPYDANQWLYFDFPAGCQTLTGDKALVYSRFRHISRGDAGLASDFSRARRQQEVIGSLQAKLIGEDGGISKKANRYWKLFKKLNQSINIKITFEDVLAGVSLFKYVSRDPAGVVLDPNLGGLNSLIVTDTSTGAYFIKPIDTSYTQLHEYLNRVRTNTANYKESPAVLVKNQSGVYTFADDTKIKKLEGTFVFKDFFYYQTESVATDTQQFYVYDFSGGEKPESAKAILKKLGKKKFDDPVSDFITQSSRGEDFVIVIKSVAEPTTI